jgi:hypothetical protein
MLECVLEIIGIFVRVEDVDGCNKNDGVEGVEDERVEHLVVL